jgi:hypothetical protein
MYYLASFNGTFVDNALNVTTNKVNTNIAAIKSDLEKQNLVTQTTIQAAKANDERIQSQLSQTVKELQTALANKKDK